MHFLWTSVLSQLFLSTLASERFEGKSSQKSTCPNVKNYWKMFGMTDTCSVIMLGRAKFYMGSDPPIAIPGDGESPSRLETIKTPFWIDTSEVTIEKFSLFVKASNYTTAAEHYGNSYVFWMEFKDDFSSNELEILRNSRRPWWWISKDGIDWRHDGNIKSKHLSSQLPVTHVSWDDADAYCKFMGGRLPTETEWEYACRGGLEGAMYPWGNQRKVNGTHMANIWQGTFPVANTKKDGYRLRAPVRSFPCNDYGVYDAAGNVWEWVTGDWSKHKEQFSVHVRVQKGGSFLCHRKHCFRYRCSARTKASRDSTSSNVGFRCAYDV